MQIPKKVRESLYNEGFRYICTDCGKLYKTEVEECEMGRRCLPDSIERIKKSVKKR